MATILIATDDTVLYDIIAAELGAQGYDVIWATDGYEACQLVLSGNPDMALLDVSLAVFDGYETCVQLREDPEVAWDFPILLLADDDLSVRKLEKVRATGQFPKTHLAVELIDAVTKHLGPKAG